MPVMTRHATWIERTAYAALSQAGWFACVLSAAHGIGWLGCVCALLLVAAHLRRAVAPQREAMLLSIVTLGGWLWECVPAATGWLQYPNGIVLAHTAPYWLAGLWLLFAIQINTLFRWLRQRYLLASLLAAITVPLSFHAGAALGAVTFAAPWQATLLIAAGWSVMMPAMVWLGTRLDGTSSNSD